MRRAAQIGTGDIIVSRVRTFIEKHRLISPGELVLSAVSGGVDSMVMTEILHGLSRELRFSLHIAHFDHMLRGPESLGDAYFVRAAAGRMGLPFSQGRGDVRALMRHEGKGLEEIARTLRYAFLLDLAKGLGAHKIATAHHADDQAETIMMRLLRGTGLRGLAGIRPRDRRGLVRPLLFLRKSEISEFARTHGILYREDATNVRSICLRNLLRNEVFPSLGEARREKLILDLSSLADSARDATDLLEAAAGEAFRACLLESQPDLITLDLKKSRVYHYVVRREMFRRAYREIRQNARDLPRNASYLLFRLCEESQSGKEIALPGGVKALRSFDTITLRREAAAPRWRACRAHAVVPGMDEAYTIGECLYRVRAREGEIEDPAAFVTTLKERRRKDVEYFDAESLSQPVFIRSWQQGDAFCPLGLQGTKKISDLLQEAKVPRHLRGSIPLLTEVQRVLWIAGIRRSSHAAVAATTRRILEVSIVPEGG